MHDGRINQGYRHPDKTTKETHNIAEIVNRNHGNDPQSNIQQGGLKVAPVPDSQTFVIDCSSTLLRIILAKVLQYYLQCWKGLQGICQNDSNRIGELNGCRKISTGKGGCQSRLNTIPKCRPDDQCKKHVEYNDAYRHVLVHHRESFSIFLFVDRLLEWNYQCYAPFKDKE
eukprot:CAMPEP_0197282226 /NCGR_PEP_ID=MMETSP1432-20130617/23884_1 /TAXON_ID=44447 /ORGANISM="Pseudo-nitzschia delicatissima, Strain UNC1205" /LENGTH=170 /DNA_ID=CAMNT_0042749135 /DNA_START=61 /DNA_END=570 /DNA_ORIENTATION=-